MNPLARCNREKIGKKDVPVTGKVASWEFPVNPDTADLSFFFPADNAVHASLYTKIYISNSAFVI